MGSRRKVRVDHRDHPDHDTRRHSWRSVRRSTRESLHVALVEDPELADTALPELRRDTRPIIVDEPSERPRRRLRHWKTKDWKRRNLRRRQRNQQERFVAS